jgi:hypothetical protein
VVGLKAWLRQRAALFVHKGARLVGEELADPVYDQVGTPAGQQPVMVMLHHVSASVGL